MNTKSGKKPYSQRTDPERLVSNWTKTCGLFERKEYSMAIIRAATCAEIAANIVVRRELISIRNLDPKFVDSLLVWANGLQGKFSKLILPIFHDSPRLSHFKGVFKQAGKINQARNEIAHGGRFAKEESARKLIEEACEVCAALVKDYEPKLKLPKI